MKAFTATLVVLLGVVVGSEAFLVHMRKAEFLAIVECISISREPALCAKYAACEKTMPYRVYIATQKCQKEHVGHQALRCSKHEPLYKNAAIPAYIFDCVIETVKKLSPPEKSVMIKFEECAKKLKEESCKVVASHAHRHSHIHRALHHHH